MPHITKNGNTLEGHRPDPNNPGKWQTLSPEGVWGSASDSEFTFLDTTFPSGSAGGGVEGDFTFLLQGVDPNRPVIKTAPNGDLIAINPAEIGRIFEGEPDEAYTVIAKGVGGVAPIIRLDGNGNLIAIDPSDPTKTETIVKASKAPVPTRGDIERLASVRLPSGQVVTYIKVGGQIQSFVGEGAPHLYPFVSGSEKFDDGVTRVFFSDGTFRDVPAEKPLPTGYDSLPEAEAAGQAAGINSPKIWVDTTGRFHYDIPEDPAPSGTKIVSKNVVGNEIIYELENGQVIRQNIPTGIERPEEIPIGNQIFAFNPNTGGFQQVIQPDREFDPGVITRDGRAFLQQPDGSLTPLEREEVPNLDELINARILSGDAEGALALADFRDRPTSMEAFNAAMQFAQSPGDVAAISAIARGQSLVEPPPSGTVQRIAEPPEFLQDAYQRLINQFRGGTGSPEQFIDVLTRINKERDDRQKTQTALEKELDAAHQKLEDTITRSKIDKILAEERARRKQADTTPAQAARASPPAPAPDEPPKPTPETFDFIYSKFGDDGDDFASFEEPEDVSGEEQGNSSFSVSDSIPDDVTTTEEAEAAGGGFSELVSSGGFDEDDFFARGGIFDDNTAIVGEKGAELIIAAPGTRVIPLGGGKKAKSAADRLRKAGIRSMQDGGIVEPLLPFGVRRALAGATIDPTRRRLSRAAGLPVLSAQARRNLLPEELEVFNRLSREAGIPEGAFRQEQESAFPGANLARGRARFAPRVLR